MDTVLILTAAGLFVAVAQLLVSVINRRQG